MKWLKVLSVIAILAAMFFAWDRLRYPEFLSLTERLKANVVWENIGKDGIRCVKLKSDKKRYLAAVNQLELRDMSSYPEYDKYPANCSTADWWNVKFPTEAQNYRRGKSGSPRILTAFINGYLYYAYEVR